MEAIVPHRLFPGVEAEKPNSSQHLSPVQQAKVVCSTAVNPTCNRANKSNVITFDAFIHTANKIVCNNIQYHVDDFCEWKNVMSSQQSL
jgi:hypothetical protein